MSTVSAGHPRRRAAGWRCSGRPKGDDGAAHQAALPLPRLAARPTLALLGVHELIASSWSFPVQHRPLGAQREQLVVVGRAFWLAGIAVKTLAGTAAGYQGSAWQRNRSVPGCAEGGRRRGAGSDAVDVSAAGPTAARAGRLRGRPGSGTERD